jgi:hypothetical protein
MENSCSNDQQNSPKLGSCCCGPKNNNNNQEIVPAAVEEKNQLISKIIRILMRAVGIFVARKVILWAIGFGPYGVISNSLATKLMAYAEHTKTSLKGLVALLQSGGSGFTPSKGYIAFVAGQIIFVVAPEIKSRLLKSQQVLAQHDPILAKIQIVTNDSNDNNSDNNNASLRPKL